MIDRYQMDQMRAALQRHYGNADAVHEMLWIYMDAIERGRITLEDFLRYGPA